MIRVVIPDDEPVVVAPSASFAKLSEVDVQTYSTRPKSGNDLIERISEADAVINVRATTLFSREVLERCPRLKLISIWGTGTDNIDLDAAKSLGIRVANTPGVSAPSVAEHALMLMLAVARRIVEIDRDVHSGKWPRAMVTQLCGKTLGLIGMGAIGKVLAQLGKGIGMKVIAWTFHPSDSSFEWVSFEEIFRRSDVVSIHVRQSPESFHMVDRKYFAMMKPSAIFINTARGAIVNEADLADALQRGLIAGAGLDVFEKEPLPPSSPLLALKNVVLTPHAAGATPEIVEAGISLAIQNIFQFLEGRPQNIVV